MNQKDSKLLVFIIDFLEANRYAPTYTEMMEGVGEKSKRGIFTSLARLEQAGRIARVPGKSRALRILSSTPMGSDHTST